MSALLLIPAVLSLLVLAAHFLRSGNLLLVAGCLAICPLMLLRKRWVARLVQVVLIVSALNWVLVTNSMAVDRIDQGRDWKRAAIILLSVALVNVISAILFSTPPLRRRYQAKQDATFEPAVL